MSRIFSTIFGIFVGFIGVVLTVTPEQAESNLRSWSALPEKAGITMPALEPLGIGVAFMMAGTLIVVIANVPWRNLFSRQKTKQTSSPPPSVFHVESHDQQGGYTAGIIEINGEKRGIGNETLAALEDLRKRGVEERNAGERLESLGELPGWIAAFRQWEQEVMAILRPIAPVEAGNFETLNEMSNRPYENALNEEHRRHLRMFSEKLDRLKDAERRLSD